MTCETGRVGHRSRVLLFSIVSVLGLTALTALLLGTGGPTERGGAPEREAQRPASLRFQPMRVLDVQPAIKNPPVIAADRVRRQVNDTELVLAVVIEGEARAYPINMLVGPRREIINDTLGGRAIAATW